MNLPTVGAVIAVRNQDRFIAAAVESLLSQVDQLTVVDDESTDATPNVLERLSRASGGKLVTILLAENLGVSAAFNLAVEHTRTDIVLIQGGDDISLPDRSGRARSVLQSGAVLACARPQVIDANGLNLDSDFAPEFNASGRVPVDLIDLFFNGNFICAPSAAMWRSEYLRLGGFAEQSRYNQDYLLWLKVAAQGSILYADDPVVKYRKHATNLSRQSVRGQDQHRRVTVDLAHALAEFTRWASDSTLVSMARSRPGSALVNPEAQRQLLELLPLMHHPEPEVARLGWQGVSHLLERHGDWRSAVADLGLSESDFRIGLALHTEHRGNRVDC